MRPTSVRPGSRSVPFTKCCAGCGRTKTAHNLLSSTRKKCGKPREIRDFFPYSHSVLAACEGGRDDFVSVGECLTPGPVEQLEGLEQHGPRSLKHEQAAIKVEPLAVLRPARPPRLLELARRPFVRLLHRHGVRSPPSPFEVDADRSGRGVVDHADFVRGA